MLWMLFYAVISLFLITDLALDRTGWRKHLIWTILWITLSLVWNGIIYITEGPQSALNFLAAYILEKSLSFDNLALFFLVFISCQLSPVEQKKVLTLGVIAAIILRLLFIMLGLKLLRLFSFFTYILAGFVIYTGIKLIINKGQPLNIEAWKKRLGLSLKHDRKERFWIIHKGKIHLTKLGIALILVEFADLIFALDSIPAVLAITEEPLIAYTSNICAILGLRSLYFVLVPFMKRLRKTHWALGATLVLIGLKMVLHSFVKIPNGVVLAVVFVILGTAFIDSFSRKDSSF